MVDDETGIPGVPVGPDRHVEVTGVDFYRTVEQLPLLKPMYKLARRKLFDVYEASGKVAARLTSLLRGAHTGLLPMYLAWCVLGLHLLDAGLGAGPGRDLRVLEPDRGCRARGLPAR